MCKLWWLKTQSLHFCISWNFMSKKRGWLCGHRILIFLFIIMDDSYIIVINTNRLFIGMKYVFHGVMVWVGINIWPRPNGFLKLLSFFEQAQWKGSWSKSKVQCKAPRWGHPQNKGPRIRHEMSMVPHHGNVHYPWASPIVLYNMQPMLSWT
jgi:hypothetical protein